MQLGPSSGAKISDGLMAAMALLSEKPRQGVPSKNPALHPGIDERNSTAALGLRASERWNRVRSRYTGKERDTESGLDYFGARYYASTMGRFMSPDWSAKEDPVPYAKLDNPQSLNLYSYVYNNPLGRADADGHQPPEGEVEPEEMEEIREENALTPLQPAPAMRPLSPMQETVGNLLYGGPVEKAIEQNVDRQSQIGANAAQGKAFQDAVAAKTAQTDSNVVQNVTVKTQSGVKTVIDVVSKNSSGATNLQEAKSSATARLTPNQAAGHPEIQNSGATVVGRGKPGFPGGTKIPPTPVKVVRPDQP
jgi:RHS repeat-associated protein